MSEIFETRTARITKWMKVGSYYHLLVKDKQGNRYGVNDHLNLSDLDRYPIGSSVQIDTNGYVAQLVEK